MKSVRNRVILSSRSRVACSSGFLCTLLCVGGATLGVAVRADSSRPARRQADPSHGASSKPLTGGFDAVFTEISRKLNVTIVAEGVPSRQALSGLEAATIEGLARTTPDAPANVQISRLAGAFDYDTDRIDSHTFVLKKHYSDPTDLPCVTYAEVVHALKSVLGVVDSFSPGLPSTGHGNMTFALFDSMDSSLRKGVARAGGNSSFEIKFTDLNAAQQQLALASARRLLSDSKTAAIRKILAHLITLRDGRTVFTWVNYDGERTFAYEGRFAVNGQVARILLTNGYMAQASGNLTRPGAQLIAVIDPSTASAIASEGRTRPDGHNSNRTTLDPSVPSEQDRLLAHGMLSNRLASTVTIGELAKIIGSESSGKIQVTAEPAIADKPVSIFGRRSIGVNPLLKAVASVYGLQSLSPTGNQRVIAMPRARILQDPLLATSEIKRLIPPSLLRYNSAQTDRIIASLPADALPPNVVKGAGAQAARERGLRDRYSLTAGSSGYFPADRRLLVLAMPAASSSNLDGTPVASLFPEAGRLIALMQLSNSGLSALEQLTQYLGVRCLANPSEMRIQIEVVHTLRGMDGIAAKFGYTDASGNFQLEGGGGAYRIHVD